MRKSEGQNPKEGPIVSRAWLLAQASQPAVTQRLRHAAALVRYCSQARGTAGRLRYGGSPSTSLPELFQRSTISGLPSHGL